MPLGLAAVHDGPAPTLVLGDTEYVMDAGGPSVDDGDASPVCLGTKVGVDRFALSASS